MITKTNLNQIEKVIEGQSAGTIQTRFRLVIASGSNELKSSWHRAAFAPGCDVTGLINRINADVVSMGYPPISVEDAASIQAECNATWTPGVIAAYQAANAML